MANLKNIAQAFVDGFAPLDALFGSIERPGSRDNLISNARYPSIEVLALKLKTGGDLRKQGVRALVASLRAKATEIEKSAALQESERIGSTHGS